MSNATNFVRCNGSRKKGHFFLLFTGGSLGGKISHKITYQCTIMFFQKMWRRFILTPCACSVKKKFHYEMHISKKMVLVAVKFSHMYKTLYCVVIKWSCVDGKTWVRVFVIFFCLCGESSTAYTRFIYVRTSLSLAGTFRSPYPGTTQQPQEQRYPFLSVCAVFSYVRTMVWLPVFGICNVHVDAYDCMRVLYGHRESPLKVELGRKIPCKHDFTYLVFLLPL